MTSRLRAEAADKLRFLEEEHGFTRDDRGAVVAWVRDGQRVAVTQGILARLFGGFFFIEWTGPGMPRVILAGDRKGGGGYETEVARLAASVREGFRSGAR